MRQSIVAVCVGLCLAVSAFGADTKDGVEGPTAGTETAGPATRADKSGYTLFNPTPREFMREMSTDRPDTTESPYTVDAGHYQLELSFADYTYDRRTHDGTKTHAVSVAPMLLKVGLLNNVDLQLGLDPGNWSRTEDRASGSADELCGFGDTVVRLKVNLWGNDGGPTAFALMPFVRFPTSTGNLGGDHVEGGLIMPLSIDLPYDFGFAVMAEIDINRADDRYVLDFVHTVTLGRTIWGDLGGFVEYAGFANWNRAERYRGYVNLGLTYAVSENVQLDTGVRLGVTRAAEDLGLFVGLSLRY